MPLHPYTQCFDAPQGKKAVPWSRHGADGILQRGELLGQVIIRCDQYTSDHIGMAPQVFCGAVHDHIRTQLKRALKNGCCERVVHHQ